MKPNPFHVGALALAALAGCQPGGERPFPAVSDAQGLAAGEFASASGELPVDGTSRAAEFVTISVPEDPSDPEGPLLQLPVVRFPGTSDSPRTPLFLLRRGPGLSNIDPPPAAWMFNGRDVVLVGYRGVDGSVVLDCPSFSGAVSAGQLPLSPKNMRRLGRALAEDAQRLAEAGIDVTRYTLLDVVADLEAVRRAFDYEEVDLYSEGYGTRVAYLYGRQHPERIHRSLMVGANPPGHFVGDPDVVDEIVAKYAELWEQDEGTSPRTRDLLVAMQEVFDNLPRSWMFSDIDPDKIRCMTFLMLGETRTAAQMLDALVEAREDERAGLALLSSAFDRNAGTAVIWGDCFAKILSAEDEPDRDYLREMYPRRALVGAPLSQLLAAGKLGGWPIRTIPDEYRVSAPSDVETLMVNGSMDVASPARFARDELLPVLTRGHLVVLEDMAHVDDLVGLQPEAFAHMSSTFLSDGVVDDSRFVHQDIVLEPDESLVELAHGRMRAWLLAGVALVLVMFLGRWAYLRLRPHSIQRAAAARRAVSSAPGS